MSNDAFSLQPADLQRHFTAITVFEGADHAYNLFTSTDVRYRGRKLEQAVKSLALRKALTFGVNSVRKP